MKKNIANLAIENADSKSSEREWKNYRTVHSAHSHPHSLWVHLPKDFNIHELLKEYPTGIPSFEVSKVAYILHQITFLSAIPDYRICNHEGFVAINKSILNEIGLLDYQKYINYLVKCGVIERSKQNMPESKSKGVRFTNKYLSENRAQYINHPSFMVLYLFWKRLYEDEVKKVDPYQTRWWRTHKIQIDYSAAHECISETLQHELEIAGYDNSLKRKAYYKYNSSLLVIDQISRKDHYVKFINENVQTLFTMLPQKLRKYIRFSGKKLASIDLKDCQKAKILDPIHFFEKIICSKIRETYPQIPIFVQFGSIITTEKHLDIVKSIIEEEVTGYYDISTPILIIEKWD